MKKLTMLVLMMMIAGSAFAGGSRPPVMGTYAYCNYQVEQAAKKAGLVNPWAGGDIVVWSTFTRPLYNQCRCVHYGKPYEGQSCS